MGSAFTLGASVIHKPFAQTRMQKPFTARSMSSSCSRSSTAPEMLARQEYRPTEVQAFRRERLVTHAAPTVRSVATAPNTSVGSSPFQPARWAAYWPTMTAAVAAPD